MFGGVYSPLWNESFCFQWFTSEYRRRELQTNKIAVEIPKERTYGRFRAQKAVPVNAPKFSYFHYEQVGEITCKFPADFPDLFFEGSVSPSERAILQPAHCLCAILLAFEHC